VLTKCGKCAIDLEFDATSMERSVVVEVAPPNRQTPHADTWG